MEKANRNILQYFAAGLLVWLLLILRFGYTFGTGDAAEFQPYALKIADPSLYKTDLFIQNLWENPVNERIVFCTFLSWFSANLEAFCLAMHIIFTVLLVSGLTKVSEAFLGRGIYAFSVPFILLLIFTMHFPGGADMWMNNFQPDLIAYTCGVWSIYFLLQNKILIAALFISAATFFHPLIGLFAAVPVFGGSFLHIWLDKKMPAGRQGGLWKSWVSGVIFYIATAGVYLFFLQRQPEKILSSESYFKIFFQLRYPHHTLPSHFGKLSLIALIVFALSGIFYFRKREKKLFWFLLIQCFAFVFYAVSVELFHWVEIGLTQWFRSSTFTFLLGIIALTGFAKEKINWQPKWPKFIAPAVLVLSFLSILILISNPYIYPFKNVFEVGKNKLQNPEIAVSQKIREAKMEGTFVLPFNFNAHKFYARQSSFVDWKTIPRKNAQIAEWYRRINLVYGLDTSNNLHGFHAQKSAENYYRNIDELRLQKLAGEGVTHILFDTVLTKIPLKPALQQNGYFVYIIPAENALK